MIMEDMETPANVVVSSETGGDPVFQPETFRCCPLGIQFYSREKLTPYRMLEVSLKFPSESAGGEAVKCSGVVVHCRKTLSSDLYRVWVMFSDLSQDIRDKLKCMSHDAQVKCPHCENF